MSAEISKLEKKLDWIFSRFIRQREAKDNSVAVRKRGQGDLGSKKLEEFINQIKEEIDRKGEVPRL